MCLGRAKKTIESVFSKWTVNFPSLPVTIVLKYIYIYTYILYIYILVYNINIYDIYVYILLFVLILLNIKCSITLKERGIYK